MANNPIAVILGGIFGGAPAPNAQPPSYPRETQVGLVAPQEATERFTTQGSRDEQGYVQMTVKGRAVLVDPRTRRIVKVLE